ncbi:MAG TPA: replication-relaxation family protein [Lacipirellulaceae bacterium]|nr:replication-relaxation family protein [Lacipirellulaceae bacterium]
MSRAERARTTAATPVMGAMTTMNTADVVDSVVNASDRPRRVPVVTDRDLCILRDLFDSRILTAAHLADIHFNGSRDAVRQRIPVLKAARLIAARPRATPYEPEVLTLAKAGFDLLLNKGELADFPAMTWDAMEKRCRVSPLTLRHELAVGDFKAAVHAAARRAEGVRVVEFLTWPALSRFTSRRTLPGGYTKSVDVKADAFARLVHATTGGDAEHVFFAEIDRSTETLDRIVARASAYATHYQSGNFAKWMGGDGTDVAAYPFRVLWLFKSTQRLLHFARGCLNSRRSAA